MASEVSVLKEVSNLDTTNERIAKWNLGEKKILELPQFGMQ